MTTFDLIKSFMPLELCNTLHLPIGTKIIGNELAKVNQLASISNATDNCISFVDPNSFHTLAGMVDALRNSDAGIAIAPLGLQTLPGKDKTFILVDNPRKWFIHLIKLIVIKPKNYIHFGNHCSVSDKAIIGDTGFGYFLKDMDIDPFPQIGYVNIGDYVIIQAFSAINRGSLGTTRIGDHTKINKFVNVGHNVHIGRHCIIQAFSWFGGCSIIGNNTWIGPGTIIRDHITVGNNCIIGMGSVVTKDVEDGKTIMGNPAK